MSKGLSNTLRLAIGLAILSGCGPAGQPAPPAATPAQPAAAPVVAANAANTDGSSLIFQGRSAAAWIETLQGAGDAKSRAAAAEVLGFLARETNWTSGWFSDVPRDTPEPAKLSTEELEPTVAALSVGLSDAKPEVRLACALALEWMGTRAKGALPALIQRLDDADKEIRRRALKAIGGIGPTNGEATARLKQLLADDDRDQVNVAEAMRKTGVDPAAYLPALIACLATDDASSAAKELAQLGDPAIPDLLQALKDRDAKRRGHAAYAISNMAGWENLTKDRAAVAKALVALLQDADRSVVWYAAQALGSVHAAPEISIPAIVSLLSHEDEDLVDEAAEGLREFGKEAKSALPALVKALARRTGRAAPVDHAIHEIGLDLATAQALSKLKIEAEVWWLMDPMLDYPDLALDFLRLNPKVIETDGDSERVLEVMRGADPRYQQVRELLFASENLPLLTIAQLGDKRFFAALRTEAAAGQPLRPDRNCRLHAGVRQPGPAGGPDQCITARRLQACVRVARVRRSAQAQRADGARRRNLVPDRHGASRERSRQAACGAQVL